MKLTAIDRSLIKMLFQRGSVTQMSGTYMDGSHERRWEIILRPKNLFRDDSYFEVGVSSSYEWIAADTLDDAFNELEKLMEVAA